ARFEELAQAAAARAVRAQAGFEAPPRRGQELAVEGSLARFERAQAAVSARDFVLDAARHLFDRQADCRELAALLLAARAPRSPEPGEGRARRRADPRLVTADRGEVERRDRERGERRL